MGIIAIILLLLAISAYFWANPPERTYTFNFAWGIVSIRMPSLLEQDETDEHFKQRVYDWFVEQMGQQQ